MTTETPPVAEGAADPAGLQTEAAELRQDVKEAKQEAQQARKDGDDERAERLEQSIAATNGRLDKIETLLEEIKGRPFHPAPGDGAPAAAEGGAAEGGAAPAAEGGAAPAAAEDGAGQTGKRKKRRAHFMFGERWNSEDS
jgi:hypothetical protein